MYECHPTRHQHRVHSYLVSCSIVQERRFSVQQAADCEKELNSLREKQKADMKALEAHFMTAKQDLERSKSYYLCVITCIGCL